MRLPTLPSPLQEDKGKHDALFNSRTSCLTVVLSASFASPILWRSVDTERHIFQCSKRLFIVVLVFWSLRIGMCPAYMLHLFMLLTTTPIRHEERRTKGLLLDSLQWVVWNNSKQEAPHVKAFRSQSASTRCLNSAGKSEEVLFFLKIYLSCPQAWNAETPNKLNNNSRTHDVLLSE